MTGVLGVIRIEVAVFAMHAYHQIAADMAVQGFKPANIYADSESEQTIEAQVLQIITQGQIDATAEARLLEAAAMLARIRRATE